MSRDQFADVPMNERFADVQAEHQILFEVMKGIASTDCRYGVDMQELASATIREILEARIDTKIKQKAMQP